MVRERPVTPGGFTLVEVLVALALSAVIAASAYLSLATVIDGVDRNRAVADRSWEINRALRLLSRDLRQVADRPVRDEFGDLEPALTGGPVARYALSLTRSGWHNPNAHPRSALQRVNYLLEDSALWRESYPVLDRAGDTQPQRVMLLDGVDELRLGFLGDLDNQPVSDRGTRVDTRSWPDSWVVNAGEPGDSLALPLAVELELVLNDWGELRRLYVLPPL